MTDKQTHNKKYSSSAHEKLEWSSCNAISIVKVFPILSQGVNKVAVRISPACPIALPKVTEVFMKKSENVLLDPDYVALCPCFQSCQRARLLTFAYSVTQVKF